MIKKISFLALVVSLTGIATQSSFGDVLSDETKEYGNQFVSGVKQDLTTTTQNVGNSIKNGISTGFNWIKGKASSAGEAISGAAHTAVDWTKTAAHNTGEAIVTGVKKVDDWVDEKEYQLARTVLSEETIDNYRRFKSGAKEDLATAAHNTGEAISGAAHTAVDRTKTAAHNTGEAISGAAHTAVDWTQTAAHNTGEAISGAAHATKEKALAAGSAVKEEVTEIAQIVEEKGKKIVKILQTEGNCNPYAMNIAGIAGCSEIPLIGPAIKKAGNKIIEHIRRLLNDGTVPQDLLAQITTDYTMCLNIKGGKDNLNDVTVGTFYECCHLYASKIQEYEGFDCGWLQDFVIQENNRILQDMANNN